MTRPTPQFDFVHFLDKRRLVGYAPSKLLYGFVKTSGLRWISLSLLASIPWAQRVWALPFLTVLAPSERYYQERARRHNPCCSGRDNG